MLNLAAVILTKNEAFHIADCIASIKPYVDAVYVLDSLSEDATAEIANKSGAILLSRPFDNFSAQRQAALDRIEARWLLFVDADERVTPELGGEINQMVANPAANGYWIPRRNFIVGYEMKAGGFSPDYQLRLLLRSKAKMVAEREVHEIVDVGGSEGYLQQPFVHYNYQTWAQFYRKQRFYATYEAKILKGRGIRPKPHNFILQPLREFRRRYWQLQGWRDGWRGLRMALLLAWYYGALPYWLLYRQAV